MGRGNTIVILLSVANSFGKQNFKRRVNQLLSLINGDIGEGKDQGKRHQDLSLEASWFQGSG